ncbi:MAG: glycosyltransferase family 4 protein [Planctomycetes bacterium]|nr:glycosyltransferase family 4 protein [Planctomycetota bacterium]
MKVLITHERFAPDFAGGGEYVALETARSLQRKGVQVRVLTAGDPRRTDYEGIETIRLPLHRYRLNFAWRRIRDLARESDLIHTFNYHACLPSLRAGRSVGVPVVCLMLALFREAWKEMRGTLAGRAWMAWERYLLTRPFDRVLFPSDYSRDQGVALGVRPEIAVVNNPGIELELYRPAAVKEDVILFVGKLEVRKGIFDVLEAARAVPEAQFRVMGWGAQESSLKRQAPPNVEFVTFERGAKLREAFAAARIFLLPSRAETFGIALVEAMASGCAIITTIPLPYEGVPIVAGDLPGLVDAVRRLWADRELTQRMGRANVALAQQFTWERHAEVLIALYGQLLSGRAR